MPNKIPTIDEYKNYDGAHTHQLWNALGDGWKCPGCGRSKFEIMRWTTRYFKKGVGRCSPYKGWMAALHRHHDHSAGFPCGELGRFPETIICDQCNTADGTAKKQLNLPTFFSFSPEEIRDFIIPGAHVSHRVNLKKAREIFVKLNNP